MNHSDGFDRTVSDWLHVDAEHRVPDHLDAVLRRTRTERQRPAWSSLERWLPMQTTLRFTPVPRVAWLLVIAGLVVALGAAILVRRRRDHALPPPFGIARNGPIVHDAADGDIHVVRSRHRPHQGDRRRTRARHRPDVLARWVAHRLRPPEHRAGQAHGLHGECRRHRRSWPDRAALQPRVVRVLARTTADWRSCRKRDRPRRSGSSASTGRPTSRWTSGRRRGRSSRSRGWATHTSSGGPTVVSSSSRACRPVRAARRTACTLSASTEPGSVRSCLRPTTTTGSCQPCLPTAPSSPGGCGTSFGLGRIHVVDVDTGTGPDAHLRRSLDRRLGAGLVARRRAAGLQPARQRRPGRPRGGSGRRGARRRDRAAVPGILGGCQRRVLTRWHDRSSRGTTRQRGARSICSTRPAAPAGRCRSSPIWGRPCSASRPEPGSHAM